MNHEEILLWRSFLDGDRRSFHDIYARYYNSLYEYGMRRINNPEQVKDAIQDLFVKLWTNRRGLSNTDNIQSYLFMALKRRLIDAAASASARPVGSLEESEFFLLEFSADSAFLQREQHGEQARKLLAALEQLTGRQKEIIYLRFFEEMSYEQIAEIMDISVKGAYKLSHRALDALKDILKLSKRDLLLLLLLCRMHG